VARLVHGAPRISLQSPPWSIGPSGQTNAVRGPSRVNRIATDHGLLFVTTRRLIVDCRLPIAPNGSIGVNAIPWLADLEKQSSGELSFVFLMVVVSCLTMGFVLDLIMKDLGLGPAPNGVLALIGVCLGIYLRYRLLAPYRADDAVMTVGFAMACAFLLLIALAVTKSGVLFHRTEEPPGASPNFTRSPQLRAILKNRRVVRKITPSKQSLRQ
jgi:hypothetical protein